MFMSKDMFDDQRSTVLRTATTTTQQSSLSSISSSTPPVSSTTDIDQLTPAMRKQRMSEVRQAQLHKRRGRALSNVPITKNDANNPNASLHDRRSLSSFQNPKSPLASPFSSPSPPGTPGYNASPLQGKHMQTSSQSFNLPSQSNATGSDDDENEQTAGGSLVIDSNFASFIAEKKRQEKENKSLSVIEKEMLEKGIAPVFDPNKRITHSNKLDFSDMRLFCLSCPPKNMIITCFISRNKKGIKNKMYPQYELYHEDNNRFLLAAKKRSKNKTSNYMITMDTKTFEKDSQHYLGKLRSNFVGTEFIGYDNGNNPKELTEEQKNTADNNLSNSNSNSSIRSEICAVQYESNILGSRGPRKMTAIIPRVRKDNTRIAFRPLKPEDGMLAKFKLNPNTNDVVVLQNKTPKWNDQVGAYVLNFNGRVTLASVKNFQLISTENPEDVLLQFGRVSKDTFTMDFQWPLTPVQAFQICLSSFDYKLACE